MPITGRTDTENSVTYQRDKSGFRKITDKVKHIIVEAVLKANESFNRGATRHAIADAPVASAAVIPVTKGRAMIPRKEKITGSQMLPWSKSLTEQPLGLRLGLFPGD